MEELKAKYRELNNIMKDKYKDVIHAIAVKNNVDLGVALDMLKANARGGNYEYDGEFDLTDLKRDCEELREISEKILYS